MGTVPRHDLRHADGRRLFVYGELHGSLDRETVEPIDPAALHQRHDVLTDTWVAISPARNRRPFTGGPVPGASAGCPLCPGGPEVPFAYQAAVFENRFPSFVAGPPEVPDDPSLAPSQGRCEVVLYTQQHVGSLATLTASELARVVAIWRDRTGDLWVEQSNRFVMAFENRGDGVGATISHPHGQIYAFDRLPPFIERRVATLAGHRELEGDCLTCRVVARDAGAPERCVVAADAFTVGIPFAPRWPLEVQVRARRHGLGRLGDLEAAEQVELVRLLREVVLRYDALFGFELPYMMVILEAPDGMPDWHLAVEFYPPHRSEVLMKVRASVETATGLFINDTLPEENAKRLAGLRVTLPDEEPQPATVARVA